MGFLGGRERRGVGLLVHRERMRQRRSGFLRGQSLLRRSVLPRPPALPLRRFKLRRNSGRHRVGVKYVGPIRVRQEPVGRRRRGLRWRRRLVVLVLLVVVVEERGELVVIRFHFWNTKMCVLPLQFFLKIFLIYFYNENKNTLSWKKGRVPSLNWSLWFGVSLSYFDPSSYLSPFFIYILLFVGKGGTWIFVWVTATLTTKYYKPIRVGLLPKS